MTQNTPTTVINVTVKPRGGVLYASSADIFGLNVVALNDEHLRDRLITAVKWLFKQNQKVDVDVMFPTDPAEFPRASSATVDRIVVAAAA